MMPWYYRLKRVYVIKYVPHNNYTIGIFFFFHQISAVLYDRVIFCGKGDRGINYCGHI